jgi:streptomycin 6-kinase
VAARVVGAHGERGAAWLRELPALVEALAAEWEIEGFGAPSPHAQASLVVPARGRDGVRRMLKLAPAAEWLALEAHALAHWRGHGAARLEAVDLARGALLMELVEPGTPLATLCADDDRAATAAAAEVILRLRAAPGEALPALPDLSSWTERLRDAADLPAPPEVRDACRHAWAVARELTAGGGSEGVLHGDLHHHNVLRAGREPWLAVDPKGLTGPPEAEAAALLRNPRRFVLAHPHPAALLTDRLDVLAERLGDDVRRLAGWGFALAVLAAAWALEEGQTEDVRRWMACAEAARQAARMRGAA